jgi:hypothetical protein
MWNAAGFEETKGEVVFVSPYFSARFLEDIFWDLRVTNCAILHW